MRIFIYICLFIIVTGTVAAQSSGRYRGSIPEALLRPAKGGAAHYPIDTVIGEMGQGSATDAAFSYANWVAGGLLSGRMNHPALESINPVIRESYLSALGSVEPRFYRIGGGREEPNESTSFVVRFVGRDYSITAEMYIRHIMLENESGSWMLEDFLMDEAMSREQEDRSSSYRVDSVPYERFF
jgi:hypothetical protein